MVLHPIRRTASNITTRTGGLLPLLFTLTSFTRRKIGGYFLLRYYTLASIFPLGSMVLYDARTFLFKIGEAVERPAVNKRTEVY